MSGGILASIGSLMEQLPIGAMALERIPEHLTSAEAQIIGASISHLAAETKRNADAVVAINESLHVLTRLETAQTNVLDRLKEGSIRMTDHEKRIQTIEQRMPGLNELRSWVIGGVLAGVGMMGAALLKLVIIDIPRLPVYTQPATQPPQPAVTAPPAKP